MTHTSFQPCRAASADAGARSVSRVEVRWSLAEAGSKAGLVLEADLVVGRCRLAREVSEGCEPQVLREGLIDGESVSLESGSCGLRAVTIPGVLMVVEGNGLEGAYVRSPWLDALGVRAGCLELVSLRVF